MAILVSSYSGAPCTLDNGTIMGEIDLISLGRDRITFVILKINERKKQQPILMVEE